MCFLRIEVYPVCFPGQPQRPFFLKGKFLFLLMNISSDATAQVAVLSNTDHHTHHGAAAHAPAGTPASYQWLWPILDTHIAACELLWKIGHKSPFVAEIQRRTGLNKRVFKLLSDIQDTKALQIIWLDRLPDYHYTMLVGRLALESPLRPLFEDMATSETLSGAEISAAIDTSIAYVRESAPLLERWFIGEYDAHAASPLPDAPEKRAVLANWAERRTQLEALFTDAAPEIDALIERFLHKLTLPPPPPPPPPRPKAVKRDPTQYWAPNSFSFSQKELEVVRVLLTLIPRFGVICTVERFYLTFRSLHGFAFPDAVQAERQRFETATSTSHLRFTLLQALLLLQTLHVAKHLLCLLTKKRHQLRPLWWISLIGEAAREVGIDEELRAARVQAHQLLSDPAVRNNLRQHTINLAQRFDKFVDRVFAASPGIACGRAEMVAFKKLR